MLPVPPTVRVGPYTYSIVMDRVLVHAVDSGANGTTSPELQRISVDPDRGRDAVAKTVLHEVLHAVWTNAGDRGDKVDEETAIRTLSAGLLGVLRDNPALVAYLTEVD